MPTLTSYDPLKLADLAASEYVTRSTEIGKRVSYYSGDQKKFLVNPKTKTPTDENVIINVSRKVVNQAVSFLFGDQPEIKHENQDVMKSIKAMEDFNSDDIFYTNLGEEGALAGHLFVKMVPKNGSIEWVIQDGRLTVAFWSIDDGHKAVAYMIKWSEGETEYRQDIVHNKLIDPETTNDFWTIYDLQKGKDSGWMVVKTTPWDYPFSPIVDWQNLPDRRSFYGKPDLQSIDLNDGINFTASNIGRILKFHAHPKTVLTGGTTDAIKETSVDGLWAISAPDAKVYNLEMTSDLSSSLNYMHELRSAFFSEQGAVDLDSFKDKIGTLTNFGLRVLFNDAIAKNNTKQQLYEYGIKELIFRSLYLLGTIINPEDVEIEFCDPLPENKQENAQVVESEISAGIISKQSGSEELGHDWKIEQKRMAEEKQAESGDLGAILAEAMRKNETQPGDEVNA